MRTVVIHEPDDLMRGLLHEWLSSAGYKVSYAKAADPNLRPNLIIASVSTAELGQGALIPRLQCTYPDAPVIVLCSQARSGLSCAAANAWVLGVRRIMAKPLQRSELLAAIETIVGLPTQS